MHEASLVKALLRQVEQIATAHGGTGVETIRIECGPLSGVEPELIDIAFAQQSPQSICRGAQLVITQVPLKAYCPICDAEIAIENFRFCCPVCNHDRVQITSGDEFLLADVTLQTGTAYSATEAVG